MHQYKKLQIWQEAIELVLDIYKITKSFPDEEKYNLSQQLKRAADSVASNIAEGSGGIHQKSLFSFFLSQMVHVWKWKHNLLFPKSSNILLKINFRKLM